MIFSCAQKGTKKKHVPLSNRTLKPPQHSQVAHHNLASKQVWSIPFVYQNCPHACCAALLGGFRSQDVMAAMGAGAMKANEDLEIEARRDQKGLTNWL